MHDNVALLCHGSFEEEESRGKDQHELKHPHSLPEGNSECVTENQNNQAMLGESLESHLIHWWTQRK